LTKQFSIPLDKFATDLGLSGSDLNKQFQQAELQAQAAIKANEYLADILATLQGKPINALSTLDGIIGSKPVPTQSAPADNSTALNAIADRIIAAINNGTGATQNTARVIASALTTQTTRQSAAALSGPRTTQPPRFSQPA